MFSHARVMVIGVSSDLNLVNQELFIKIMIIIILFKNIILAETVCQIHASCYGCNNIMQLYLRNKETQQTL